MLRWADLNYTQKDTNVISMIIIIFAMPSFLKRRGGELERDCHSPQPHFSSKRQRSQSQICSKYICNIQSYEPLRYQNELEVVPVKDLRHTNHYVLPAVLHTNTILCDILSNIWSILYLSSFSPSSVCIY